MTSLHTKVRALYATGKTTTQIATELGLPYIRAWSVVRELRLPARGAFELHGARVVALHHSGCTTSQIAAELRISHSCAHLIIVRAGLVPRVTGKSPPTPRQDQIRALHAAGQSVQQIATALGLTHQNIRQHLVRMGLPINKKIPAHQDEVRSLHETGMTMAAIAAQLKLPYNRVTYLVHRMGLLPNYERVQALPTTSALETDVRALYEARKTTGEIAAELRIPLVHTRQIIAKLGLLPYGNLQAHGARALELHQEGKTTTEVAAEMGISYASAWYVLTRLGLKPIRNRDQPGHSGEAS